MEQGKPRQVAEGQQSSIRPDGWHQPGAVGLLMTPLIARTSPWKSLAEISALRDRQATISRALKPHFPHVAVVCVLLMECPISKSASPCKSSL